MRGAWAGHSTLSETAEADRGKPGVGVSDWNEHRSLTQHRLSTVVTAAAPTLPYRCAPETTEASYLPLHHPARGARHPVRP
jgi:hypothetical protein